MLIKVILDDEAISEFSTDKTEVLIGRSDDCDLTIDSSFISRAHLEVKQVADSFVIRDITQNNWVSLNNDKMEKNEWVEYFNFTPLVLPGSFIILIEDNNQSKISSDTESKETENKIDIYSNVLNPVRPPQSKFKEKKSSFSFSSSSSSRNNDKSKKVILGLIVITILGIGGHAFFKNLTSVKSKNTLESKDSGNGEVILKGGYNNHFKHKKIKNVDKTKEVKEPVKTQSEPKVLSLYEKIQKKVGCSSREEKEFCKFLFEGEGKVLRGEGVFADDKNIYSIQYSSGIQKRFVKLGIDITKVSSIEGKVWASVILLRPDLLKYAEFRKKYKIHLLIVDSGKKKVIHHFKTSSSYYRRYSEKDFQLAKKDFLENGKTSMLKKILVKYLKEEKK